MTSVAKQLMLEAVAAAKPPERLCLPDWADKHRKIPAGSSPEPGNYSTARTEYMRQPMMDVSDPLVQVIILMFSAQLGKSELCINICGYFAHMEPCSMMYMMPTLAMAEKISKDRLAPTIECSPSLRKVFGANKSRATSSTILSKKYPGGVIHLCGANSPSSLSSSPMRVLLQDEVDRYPESTGDEGDPGTIAEGRTKNFWNKKIIKVSTPTDEESSAINREYEISNMNHREVPCPHCGEFQQLEFKNFKFDSKDKEVEPWFECVSCKESIEEKHKNFLMENGRWTELHPERGREVSGYRLNEFHSPFSTWMDIRNGFMACYKSLEKLRVFTNITLGEVWRDTQTLNDSEVIKARREHYDQVPEDVLVIVAGCDTQDDSLHYEIVGYGHDMQTWGIEYGILRGDPGSPELWNRLHEKLSQTFERTDGVVLNVMKACIDSAGHYTTNAYKFCQKYQGRYYPIVGRRGAGKPIIKRPTKLVKHGNLELYTVGIDTCKELFLISRIKQTEIAYGYCHYPHGRGYDDNYYNELTNVKVENQKIKGRTQRVFVDKGRVEAVDCRVYSMAALEILNPSFAGIMKTINKLKKKASTVPKKVHPEKPAKKPVKSSKRKVSNKKINRKTLKTMRKLRGKRNR